MRTELTAAKGVSNNRTIPNVFPQLFSPAAPLDQPSSNPLPQNRRTKAVLESSNAGTAPLLAPTAGHPWQRINREIPALAPGLHRSPHSLAPYTFRTPAMHSLFSHSQSILPCPQQAFLGSRAGPGSPLGSRARAGRRPPRPVCGCRTASLRRPARPQGAMSAALPAVCRSVAVTALPSQASPGQLRSLLPFTLEEPSGHNLPEPCSNSIPSSNTDRVLTGQATAQDMGLTRCSGQAKCSQQSVKSLEVSGRNLPGLHSSRSSRSAWVGQAACQGKGTSSCSGQVRGSQQRIILKGNARRTCTGSSRRAWATGLQGWMRRWRMTSWWSCLKRLRRLPPKAPARRRPAGRPRPRLIWRAVLAAHQPAAPRSFLRSAHQALPHLYCHQYVFRSAILSMDLLRVLLASSAAITCLGFEQMSDNVLLGDTRLHAEMPMTQASRAAG